MLRYLALSGTLLAFLAPELAAAAEPLQPISPTGNVVRLFNGRDLTGWYTLAEGNRPHGSKQRCSRSRTERSASPAKGWAIWPRRKPTRTIAWSSSTSGARSTDGSGIVRNAGVLLHGIGPDGGAGGAWMTCLECQLAQGCEGDLIVIRGKDEDGKVHAGHDHLRDRTRLRRQDPLEAGRQEDRLLRQAVLVVEARAGLSRKSSTRAAEGTWPARWASGPGSSASAAATA